MSISIALMPSLFRVTNTRKSKLLPRAKLVSNHLLIDPVAAIFERTAEEYRPLRQLLVSSAPCPRLVCFMFLTPTVAQTSLEIYCYLHFDARCYLGLYRSTVFKRARKLSLQGLPRSRGRTGLAIYLDNPTLRTKREHEEGRGRGQRQRF